MTYSLEPILDRLGVDYNPDRLGNQKVLCPFHEDSVQSGSVNLDEGLFFCFGCGVKGDAISLLMEHEGLDFKDAKRLVQELAGEDRPAVPGRADAGGIYLPRKQGHRPGRRAWVSPWSGRRS